jgi:chromate transport protein ChrA
VQTGIVPFVRLFGPLGLIAFGGPSVHVSILQRYLQVQWTVANVLTVCDTCSLLVEQKKLVDETSFLELFAV